MVILRDQEEVSPSSSATPRCKYEVFLSFRGKDTRMNFTDHLYTALKRKGINTFRDEERLKREKPISELFKAIEQSRFAVIVFSRNYADSTWCLDELAMIVECMKKTGLIVLPVFYGVIPSEVRHQIGTFAEAFAKHERFKERTIENVERWRSALKEVADLSGWHLGKRKESELIHEIVEMIFKKLHSPFPEVMKGLVGITHQVEELNPLLCIGSNDVRVIGITGMGGIGKTTLTKVICSIFSNDFESFIFIFVSNERNLIPLQQQLLCETLKEENICIWNVETGVNMIKNRLRSKKILLVLDDVNHQDELKYLVEERDWFGSGSRIIITTRDQHLLNAYGVDEIHECKGLNPQDSLKLFCLKAFKKEQPEKGYEEISQKFVKYANGLPLALDILGSLLVGKTINDWKDTLKRLKEYPEKDIIKKLEISYDGLNNDAEKRLFLYIACFLNGRNQDLVADILESFNLYPTSRINVLIKRSLITISDNIVRVHDLLQEMGWEILRKQSPAKPGKRIGLKLRKDILDVLTNKEGAKTIEIINQEPSTEEVANCTCNPKAFSKMRKLRFLRIHNVYFQRDIEYLSNELRILEWHGYPSKSLPLGFHPKEIHELDLRYSKIEKIWDGVMLFPNLRSIDLSFSENLTQIPNLTGAPRLEALDLQGCTNLVEGHSSILAHKRISYLNLVGCIHLKSLPTMSERKSLKTLILLDCSKIKMFPTFEESMRGLRKLYLDGIAIKEIPQSIKGRIGLTYVNFSICSKLEKPTEKLGEIVCSGNLGLKDVNFLRCSKLEKPPEKLGEIVCSRNLDLKDVNFSICSKLEKPAKKFGEIVCSGNLGLKDVNFLRCSKLEKPPEKLGEVVCSRNLDLKDVNFLRCSKLEKPPQKLGEIVCSRNLGLKDANFLRCSKLEKLPEKLGEIVCSVNLGLKVVNFLGFLKLEKPLENLEGIVCSENLGFKGVNGLRCSIKLETWYKKLMEIVCLMNLNFSICSKREKLPEKLGEIMYLENLDIKCFQFSLKEKLRVLFCMDEQTKNLGKTYRIHVILDDLRWCNCFETPNASAIGLPSALNTTSFWIVTVSKIECTNIFCTPPERFTPLESLCQRPKLDIIEKLGKTMSKTVDLDLSWCNLFEIPNAIVIGLPSLKKLVLRGNNFVTLPASICQRPKLDIIDLSYCKKLQSLPEFPSNQVVVLVHDCGFRLVYDEDDVEEIQTNSVTGTTTS